MLLFDIVAIVVYLAEQQCSPCLSRRVSHRLLAQSATLQVSTAPIGSCFASPTQARLKTDRADI
jgi:hypothetical protein